MTMGMSVDDFELSVRAYNCLKRAGINTIEELSKMDYESLMKIPNLGKKSLEEVLHKMRVAGLAVPENPADQTIKTGKDKCEYLRQARVKIARENGIEQDKGTVLLSC